MREIELPRASWWARMVARWTLRKCKHVGARVVVAGRIEVRGDGDVVIGDGTVLDGRDAPIELCAHRGGLLELGANVRVRGGASIEARSYVKIGAGAVVGSHVKVIDDAPMGVRKRGPPTPSVTIEDGAVLGARTILLPGAHVGSFARTAPASVVARSVAACAVVPPVGPRAAVAPA